MNQQELARRYWYNRMMNVTSRGYNQFGGYGYVEQPVPPPPPKPTYDPLCFTAEQDGSSVSLIGWDDYAMEQLDEIFVSLQYSTDGNNWQEWDGHVIPLDDGEKVYVKAWNPNPDGMAQYDEEYGSVIRYHIFIFEGKVAASGNIQYLLENTGSRIDTPQWAYYRLFAWTEDPETGEWSSVLTQAPALPATTLAEGCYVGMFDGCTALIQAPSLPATTLAERCYDSMFGECTSLTQAPALPATTLAERCYVGMFDGCTALTQAPSFPATTLAGGCYESMFGGCTSLTQAPALPATTLAEGCYESMFGGCTSLTSAVELPAAQLANECYTDMFFGCENIPTVNFTNLTFEEYSQQKADYIFGNLGIEDTAEFLYKGEPGPGPQPE